MIRTISTACWRLTALASSRGAVPNTSPATAGLPRSGCLTQSTNAATPACATRPSQDRFSADRARNHGSRWSMEAIDAAPSADMDCSSLAMVSALTRPPCGVDGEAFTLTSTGCHAAAPPAPPAAWPGAGSAGQHRTASCYPGITERASISLPRFDICRLSAAGDIRQNRKGSPMAGIPSEYARDVREALRSVADDPDLGPATLSDAAALSNLLKDLLPDAPREKNLLVAAAEARLAAMMADHVGQGVDAASAIRLAAASFGANTHFTTDACDWVATEFAVALGLADGLTTAPAGLPPGDITTARTPATFADSVTAPDTAAAPGESAGSAIAPAPAAKAQVSEVTASAPPAARARTGRAGIGTLVALAADAVL